MERRVLLAGTRRLPSATAPDLRGRSYRIDVELRAPLNAAEGVLLACGDGRAGFALHVGGDHLVHTYHHAGTTSITASEALDAGSTALTLDVHEAEDGVGSTVHLLADGGLVGRGTIERPARSRLAYAGLDIGVDRGPGVGDYRAPFSFTGSIRQVVVRTDPSADVDDAAAMAVDLATG